MSYKLWFNGIWDKIGIPPFILIDPITSKTASFFQMICIINEYPQILVALYMLAAPQHPLNPIEEYF